MANKRISMRKIREVLRLCWHKGLSSTTGGGKLRCRPGHRQEHFGQGRKGPPVLAPSRGPRRGLLGEPPLSLQHPPRDGEAEHALLRLYPHGTHEKAYDPPASLGGIQGEQPRRLPVQPVLPQIPGVARDPRRLPSPGLQGGREALRRLRRRHHPDPRSRDGSGHPRLSLCRHAGGEQLYLRGGRPLQGAPFLDQTPCPYVRVHGLCPGDRGPGQCHAQA